MFGGVEGAGDDDERNNIVGVTLVAGDGTVLVASKVGVLPDDR